MWVDGVIYDLWICRPRVLWALIFLYYRQRGFFRGLDDGDAEVMMVMTRTMMVIMVVTRQPVDDDDDDTNNNVVIMINMVFLE